MKTKLRRYAIPATFFVLGVLTTLLFTMLPGCEDTKLTDEGITGSFEVEAIPILPKGFPLFPKSLYAGDMSDLEDEVDDIVDEITDIGFIDIPSSVTDPLEDLLKWAFAERHPFYDPGPLSVALNQQIASIFKNTITITEASLKIEIANNTDDFWGVPIDFSLYMGDAENVYSKTGGRAGALVRTDESDECNCTFHLEPGETKEVTTENLEGLVNALNDLHSIAVDYDADIILDDIDPDDYIKLFSKNINNIGQWRMSINRLNLNLSGEGQLEFDDIYDWLDEYL